MRTAGRSSAAVIATLLTVLFLAASCSPVTGALGTPSTPAPAGDASVAPPSGDATPGPSSTVTASPAVPTAPSPEASASSSSSSPSSAPSSAPPTPTASPTVAPTIAPTPSSTSAGTVVVRAYFVLGSFTGNSGLAPVLREIPATAGVATASMRQLLAGPDSGELAAHPAMYTAIPPATRLLGLTISGGLATVNLSSEFDSGYNAASPDARFAQVTYTLTQFATVTSVAVELDGQPVGGQASVRTMFSSFLPAIFVDRPAWGASAGNPARVSGVANVFEAQFRAQLKDAGGHILVDQPVQAACGTGCWGAFATTLAYSVGGAQWGTLRVYDISMKDGSATDVTAYPVWLTP